MKLNLHQQTNVAIDHNGGFCRRDFLKALPLAAGLAGGLSWTDVVTARAPELRQRGMACILLWMQGGPSQFETFSPKPGHANGGETKAISTAVSGIEISENLPEVAGVMKDLCLVRSMNSKEGSHPRATYLMHTGYLPTASVKYPTLGSIVASEIGPPISDLPSFVRIGGGRLGDSAGLLGVNYDPFLLQSPERLPDNTALTTQEDRYKRRLNLLNRIEDNYAAAGGKQEVENHRKVYAQAAKMVLSPKMNAFDLDKEPQKVRDAYGSGTFGAGCLMARRLVETGVTFVEVQAGNWDTHDDNFSRAKDLCGQIDKPYAALINDLKKRGMLERTLVVWMGEFGRTPKINPRGGRDHYPRAFNVALAGAGVKAGQVVGATDAAGSEVKDRPVGVSDLLRTICHTLKIDADKENMSSIGRPIKLVDGGEVVKEIYDL
jgi:uncharacterized protein (DUF1501 family)